MNIITGYRDEPHVSSQQDRDANIAIYGTGVYILNVGDKLAATVISANEIEISDGLVVAEGCMAEVARGTTESITVDNGEQGMMRKDLIVLRYTKNASTNVEDMELDIIKGTSASANPSTPSYTTGTIAAGDTTVEFPIYVVNISGISITSVDCLVEKVTLARGATVAELVTKVGTTAMGTVATTVTGAIKELKDKIGSVAMGTTATTLTGAIRELLTSINGVKTKTQGIEGTRQYTANANSSVYVNLEASSVYLIIVSAWTTGTTMTGMYVVGATTGAALGIKTISAASSVALSDTGNNGILKIENSGSVTLRVTVITLSGSVPL